jgi:hypothetical protein
VALALKNNRKHSGPHSVHLMLVASHTSAWPDGAAAHRVLCVALNSEQIKQSGRLERNATMSNMDIDSRSSSKPAPSMNPQEGPQLLLGPRSTFVAKESEFRMSRNENGGKYHFLTSLNMFAF